MRIWFPLVAAPLLALADQSVSFAVVGWACTHQLPIAVHAVHALFLVTAGAGTLPALTAWRALPGGASADEALAQRRFFTGIAAAAGSLSTLAILAMWVPAWLMAPCST